MIPIHLDLELRGGKHPNEEYNLIEEQIAERAMRNVLNYPGWSELGFKRAYNFLHLLTFYMSRDPNIVRLLYKLQPFPEYLEMEVTQKCPLKCVFCEHTYWDEPQTELSFKDFKYAMEQFPNLKWAGINALGDPFTNKEYWQMLRYLDDREVVQELYTSLFLLKKQDMERFIDLHGLVFLKISFDAATKETYEKLRVGSDFDHIIENIKAFDDIKKKRGRYFPELFFHYIITKDNVHETEMYLDLLDSLDINVAGVTYSRLLHNFSEINDMFMEVPKELCDRLKEKGKKLNINVSFNADLPGSKPPANECLAWMMPYIFPDGSVISCCCMNEQNRRDWQRNTAMGNVFKKNMREIWYDKPYTQLRNYLWQKRIKEAHPVCEICNIYDIEKLSTIR